MIDQWNPEKKRGKKTSPFPCWCFRNFPSKLRSSKTTYKPQSQDKHLRNYLLTGEFQPSTVHTWYIIWGKLLLKRRLLAKNWWKALTFQVGPGWICRIVLFGDTLSSKLGCLPHLPPPQEMMECEFARQNQNTWVIQLALFLGLMENSAHPGVWNHWSTRYGCFHSQDASWKVLLEPKKSNHPGGPWYLHRAEISQRSIP